MQKSTIISIGLIIVLGFAVYANSLKGEFIWDDQHLIPKNTHLIGIAGLSKIFTHQLYAGSGKMSNFYRPLQELSYFFDYRIWRLNPFGYHLSNVIIHLLNAVLVYVLVFALSKSRVISLITALLFVVHPIHTQAVSYIAGRADLLSFTFVLLSFIFSSFAFVFYPLALLAKESAIVFPIVFCIYLALIKGKRWKAQLFVISITTLLYILLRSTLIKFDLSTTDMSTVPIYNRLLISLKGFGQYLLLLFYPHNLHMERHLSLAQSLFEPQVLISAVAFLLIIIVAFFIRRKAQLATWGILWFLLWLIPHANILPLNAFMAEHWLYLSSIGFFLVLGILFSRIYQRPSKAVKAAAIFALVAYLTFLSGVTIQRNQDWKDPLTFFKQTVKSSAQSHKAHIQLGIAYMERGDFTKAIQAYQRSIEINPAEQAYNNLGIVYLRKKLPKEAIANFKKAIELDPDYLAAYDNLASAYYFSGDLQMAERYYKKALSIWPHSASTHNNLGVVYMDSGLLDKARREFEEALRLDPYLAEAEENLIKLESK